MWMGERNCKNKCGYYRNDRMCMYVVQLEKLWSGVRGCGKGEMGHSRDGPRQGPVIHKDRDEG